MEADAATFGQGPQQTLNVPYTARKRGESPNAQPVRSPQEDIARIKGGRDVQGEGDQVMDAAVPLCLYAKARRKPI